MNQRQSMSVSFVTHSVNKHWENFFLAFFKQLCNSSLGNNENINGWHYFFVMNASLKTKYGINHFGLLTNFLACDI